MDTERSTNSKPGQLADMLGVALETGEADSSNPTEMTAKLLRNKLDGPLPPDPEATIQSSSVLDNIYDKLAPQSQLSLGEALTDPKTDLSTILQIKNDAKQTAAQDCPKAQRGVSVTLYYAAIASALLFHDRKITSYSYDAIAIAIAKLLDKPWIPPVLTGHLQAARRICLDRKDQRE